MTKIDGIIKNVEGRLDSIVSSAAATTAAIEVHAANQDASPDWLQSWINNLAGADVSCRNCWSAYGYWYDLPWD